MKPEMNENKNLVNLLDNKKSLMIFYRRSLDLVFLKENQAWAPFYMERSQTLCLRFIPLPEKGNTKVGREKVVF